MKTQKFLIICFMLVCSFGFAQTTNLCKGVSTYIKFESEAYVPTVSENQDGTITLVFFEDSITDLFAKYEIYDIEHVFKSSTRESLQNVYIINFNSQDLIVESQQNISSDILYFPEQFPENMDTEVIPEHIISALDGFSFNVTKYNSIGESDSGPMKNVPEDFNLSITFNYDISKDMLYAKSDNVSPCGNAFSIGLYGANNTEAPHEFMGLLLWETLSVNASPSEHSEPCRQIESILYYTLGLCSHVDFLFVTSIEVNNSEETSRIILRRDTAIFGQEIIELSQSRLSAEKNSFKHIKLITSDKNAYIEFTNTEKSDLDIEVFSILGERIIKKTPYKKNRMSLNPLPKGLYILRLSNSKDTFKTFKYLN